MENYEKFENDLPEYVKNKKNRSKSQNRIKIFFWENEKYFKGFISLLVLMIMVNVFLFIEIF